MEGVVFRCAACGASASGLFERCPHCFGFRTIYEAPARTLRLVLGPEEISATKTLKTSTGFRAFDEVLDGGIGFRTHVLMYGGAGSRKTTYAGAIAANVARARKGDALLICAEMESPQARALVARVADVSALSISGLELGSADLARARSAVEIMRPAVVVWDSAQEMAPRGMFAGSARAIGLVVRTARDLAAKLSHTAIVISQVNAAGEPAGPRRALHDLDTVLEMNPQRVTCRKSRQAAGPLPRSAPLPK